MPGHWSWTRSIITQVAPRRFAPKIAPKTGRRARKPDGAPLSQTHTRNTNASEHTRFRAYNRERRPLDRPLSDRRHTPDRGGYTNRCGYAKSGAGSLSHRPLDRNSILYGTKHTGLTRDRSVRLAHGLPSNGQGVPKPVVPFPPGPAAPFRPFRFFQTAHRGRRIQAPRFSAKRMPPMPPVHSPTATPRGSLP